MDQAKELDIAMSAQAVIPLEQVSATLIAGEADNIAFLILVGDYLYGLTTSTPAKLLKIKRDDFATRSVITFNNDGLHGSASGLVYALSTNRIYALFGSTGGVITEIHPDTLAAIDKVNIAGVFVAAAADCLATDNTYLFVLWDTEGIELPSRIVRYVLADLRDDNSTPLDLAVCGDSLKHAGGYLYVVSLLNPLPKIQKINATNFGAAISGTDFPVGTTQVGIDQMAVTASYLFVAFAGVPGKLWRFSQSSLAVTEIDTELAGGNVLLASAGTFVFDLSNDGQLARVNESSLEKNLYDLNDGAFYLRTMVGDGAYLYGCTLQTSTQIYRFLLPSEQGATIWSMVIGSPSQEDSVLGVAVDSGGNSFLCGNLGGQSMLAKVSPSGVLLFRLLFSMGLAQGVALDSSGNVYIVGDYGGSANLGGGALPSGNGIFVAKFTNTGTLVWQKGYVGGSVDNSGKAIAVRDTGVYITGQFTESINFGGVVLTSAGGTDIFVARLATSNGSHVWSKRYGDTLDVSNEAGTGIAVNASGSVFVSGLFVGPLDFGNGSPIGSDIDGFTICLNSTTGALVWAKAVTGNRVNRVNAVALISDGGCVVIAVINAGIQQLGTPVVIRYDTNGALVWSKSLTGIGFDLGKSIAVDASGNIYAGGRCAGTLDCGDGIIIEGQSDAFVLKLAADSRAIWGRSFGGTSNDTTNGLTTSGGFIFAAGNWYGRDVDFGDGIKRNSTMGSGLPSGDTFLIKIQG